jgi:hypothetical protein
VLNDATTLTFCNGWITSQLPDNPLSDLPDADEGCCVWITMMDIILHHGGRWIISIVEKNDLLGIPRLIFMITVRCVNDSINSILITVFLRNMYMLYNGIWCIFFSNLKMRKLFVNMLKYQKSVGIDFLNLYAQQWKFDIFDLTVIWKWENHLFLCLKIGIPLPSLLPILFLYRHI